MNKILISILGIILTIGVVSGTAYALFSDTATVSGVTLTTGSADLKINDADSLPAVALSTSNTYPGWIDGQPFKLTNASTSPIALDVTSRITSKTGSWTTLSPVVEVAIVEYSDAGQAAGAVAAKNPAAGTWTASTGWKSLADWYAVTPTVIGTTIDQSTDHYFVMWGRIPTTAGNEISGLTVSTNWVLTGTQKTP